jgi:hypothetical protein
MSKRGLKHRDVAKEHFSSGVVQSEPKFSRLVVRFLEGKNLLASDIETGTSDPIAFVWCGPCNELPRLEEADLQESGILRTRVCKRTINPIWNEDVIFPLDISNIKELMDTKCVVYVRDEDIGVAGDGLVTYDELGMIDLPFKDIFINGKAMKNSVVVSGTWYTLSKSPGMRKVEGSVKITLTVIFAPEDNDVIMPQLPSTDLGTNFSRASFTQLQSVSQRVQKFLVSPPSEPVDNGRDSRLRLSLTQLGRPSSAKTSSRSSFTVTSIAPMVRRPSTAPQKRPEESVAAPEPAGRAAGRRALRSAEDSGEDDVLEEGDEEEEEDDDEEEEGEEEDAEQGGGEDAENLDEGEEEEEGEEEGGVRSASASVQKPAPAGIANTGGRPPQQGSRQGSQQGSRRASRDSEEELTVLSRAQHVASLQQANQRRASKDGLDTSSLGVAIGGYDLQRLLDEHPNEKEQILRDLMELGVRQVTNAMGESSFSVSEANEDAARAIAERLRSVTKGLAGGKEAAGKGTAGSLRLFPSLRANNFPCVI